MDDDTEIGLVLRRQASQHSERTLVIAEGGWWYEDSPAVAARRTATDRADRQRRR